MTRKPIMPVVGSMRFTPRVFRMESKENYLKYTSVTAVPVDYETWKNIIKAFSQAIIEEVKTNRNGVNLPYRLGNLIIVSVEPSKKPWRIMRNYELGKKLKVSIEEPNLGTGGLQCKIFYSTYEEKTIRPERSLWGFKGSRIFTRGVSKAFRENWEMYRYLSPKAKISDLFHEYRKKKLLDKVPREKYNPLEA